MKKRLFFILINIIVFSCCTIPQSVSSKKIQNTRTFYSSFESVDDFKKFYIVPKGDYDSNHELTSDEKIDGNYSHKAWIVKSRDKSNDSFLYLPHRAYPTIQFQKTTDGVFITPVLVTLYCNLDIKLEDKPKGQIDDWFSFATLTPDASDNWNRTILVNITPDGYLRLVHVPYQGEQKYIFQANKENDPESKLVYPYKKWVKIDIYLDLDPNNGYAKVWQNGNLVSHAIVKGGNSSLAQAHFGLYASASISSGTIYNDKLSIIEIKNENEAISKLMMN